MEHFGMSHDLWIGDTQKIRSALHASRDANDHATDEFIDGVHHLASVSTHTYLIHNANPYCHK